MITQYPIEDMVLAANLNKKYGIEVDKLEFIPMGDSAYSYRVDCINGQKYYLKLFDHQNERQRGGIARLSYYLPLTWQLYHEGIFKNITYPIKNVHDDYKTSFDAYTTVMFNFIEGETLADAHPFPDDILKEVAKAMAAIQRITTRIDLTSLPKEMFDISFVENLIKYMRKLEDPTLVDSRNPIVSTLREHIKTHKELIHTSLNYVLKLYDVVRNSSKEFVLCHGDVWGGNMIRHCHNMYLIDWESVVAAPPEYNFWGYLGNGFDVFYTAYVKQLNQPVALNLDVLRFYSYRSHLKNLTNWLANILYGNNPEAQDNNDLDMIRNHCLNRIEPIESNILGVEAFLYKKRITF